MAYTLGYSLSPKTEKILKVLLTYRGMTAKQLTHIFFKTKQITLAQEKSIYNDLAKLKKQNLVKSMPLQQSVARGSMYYLSTSGYDCTKDLLNIHEGQTATGWLPPDYGEYDVADMSYDVYLPPLKQTAHHLMLIEFFAELHTNGDDLYEVISHRHNLYAAQKYQTKEGIQQYRPDAEIQIDEKLFTVEIDRGTESHEQLKQKFITYKHYLDTHINNKNKDIPVGILFVVETRRRGHGIQRRWQNILSAFYSVLFEYSDRVNLILTTMDRVSQTIQFEQQRDFHKNTIKQHMNSYIATKNESASFSTNPDNTEKLIAFATHSTTNFNVLFCEVAQEYESAIYRKYLHFYERELPAFRNKRAIFKSDSLIYNDYEAVIFYPKYKPHIFESFTSYKLDSKLNYKFSLLAKKLDFYSFDPILNMPVTYQSY